MAKYVLKDESGLGAFDFFDSTWQTARFKGYFQPRLGSSYEAYLAWAKEEFREEKENPNPFYGRE